MAALRVWFRHRSTRAYRIAVVLIRRPVGVTEEIVDLVFVTLLQDDGIRREDVDDLAKTPSGSDAAIGLVRSCSARK